MLCSNKTSENTDKNMSVKNERIRVVPVCMWRGYLVCRPYVIIIIHDALSRL